MTRFPMATHRPEAGSLVLPGLARQPHGSKIGHRIEEATQEAINVDLGKLC